MSNINALRQISRHHGNGNLRAETLDLCGLPGGVIIGLPGGVIIGGQILPRKVYIRGSFADFANQLM